VSGERRTHGRTISVSSLDKVFYPGAGITKGDVLDYYERIADRMMRHVEGRILTMHRWPDGIRGEDFYQKSVPEYFPDWVRTTEVEKEGGTNVQVVLDEPATLVYLAQQGSLTPHVWLSLADRPRVPDRIVFDFDPAAETWEEGFGEVRRAARRVRALARELGFDAFVATSGSRGLHVHLPLRREEEFDAVKAVARDMAELLARRHPERLTVEIRKKKRRGRVFLDFLRNEYAQTAVAPYALRARPGAPVATPLEWDELSSSGMGPRRYTLQNLFRRLGQKDDPWKGMQEGAVSLAPAREALDTLLAEEAAGDG
jgi:bifunctional non-homologous end joining protein LigD